MSILYKDETVYKIQKESEDKDETFLYIERQKAEYRCIAWEPENSRVIGCYRFTEPLFLMNDVVAKALKTMQIPYTDVKRIELRARMYDTGEKPDRKICLLKTLAGRVPQDERSETVGQILKIIDLL